MPELKRIAVFGPESTGKTSLARALAGRFGEPWVPEFVRAFWDERAGKILAEDLPTIARGQIAAEEAAAASAKRSLFCDTELLTNVIWADLLFPGKCEQWVRAEADARAKYYALYLLCDIDIPFVEDPQRSFPDQADRERCARIWRETLTSRRLPFVEIRGDWKERERCAIEAVEKILRD